MELDFDKYCKLSGSPNTVLPSPRPRSKHEKRRSTKKDPSRKSDLFTLDEDFAEINFQKFRSISCKNIRPRAPGLERNEVLRRGSVYHSSTERTNLEKVEEFEGRKKIELSGKDSILSTFGIVDSLCSSDEDSSISEMTRSSILSKNSEPSSEKMSDISFDFGKENVVSLERGKFEISQFRNKTVSLHKSISAKLEGDSSRPSNPKARFGPIRNMFDPFKKSKSMRNPLGPSRHSITKNETFQKSWLSEFSKLPKGHEVVPRESSISSSPTHLHACLKLETKFGSPFFEFSLKSSEDVLVARRWKTENGLHWVYTFYSFPDRRKSNATTQWELKDLTKVSSLVGKMQVSSYLHTEMKSKGEFHNSVITEFVMYDATKSKNFNSSAQKSLEIAAAAIQIPYEERESLKHKGGDGRSNHLHPSLLELCGAEEKKDLALRVNVIFPLGSHGLPNADVEGCGPSSLLERWRSKSVCDCGGWDMGCPLTVFGNSDLRSFDNRLVLENHRPLELFVKGSKEKAPALVITAIGERRYSIDFFDAKLSSLQAFSMCVAILHCTEEASIDDTREREKHLSKRDSLRVFVEEEISDLIGCVKEDEKKVLEIKEIEEMIPSFNINPPFSPMARV